MLKVHDKPANAEAQDEDSTLDDLAREGARRMLMKALAVEITQYVEEHGAERDEHGRRLVVRNGQAQARKVTCGAGTLEVRAPRVNDKRVDAAGQRERFTSRILPPYMRRSPKVAEVLPILYLRGLSTGDFREALPVLLGDDAAGLSATNIARLTAVWDEEYRQFRQRDLADRDYVYVWVDGIHFNIRLEDDRLCTLVMIGARPNGTKELVALEDGYRESTDSWAMVLRALKRQGMRAPMVAGRRWGLGLLGRGTGGLAGDGRAARLVPQAGECARQVAQAAPAQGETSPSRDHGRRHPRAGGRTAGGLRRDVRGEVPQGGGVSGRRPRAAVHLLRLPGGTLDAPSYDERDRIALRYGSTAPARDQRRGLADEGLTDGPTSCWTWHNVGGAVSTAHTCCRSCAPACRSSMVCSRNAIPRRRIGRKPPDHADR